MIVYYEGSIHHKILDEIYRAEELGKVIEQIALDDREGKEFEAFLRSLPDQTPEALRTKLSNRIAQLNGVEVVW